MRLFNVSLLEVVRVGGDLVAATVPDDRRRRGDGDGQALAGDDDRDRVLLPLRRPGRMLHQPLVALARERIVVVDGVLAELVDVGVRLVYQPSLRQP